MSELIASIAPSPARWSHCGVIVKGTQGILVAHTLSSLVSERDGCRLEGLEGFVKDAVPGTLALYRPKIPEEEARIAAERCDSFAESAIPFDSAFSYGGSEDAAYYCSEMAARAFDGVLPPAAFEFLPFGSGRIVGFGAFSKGEYWEPIFPDPSP